MTKFGAEIDPEQNQPPPPLKRKSITACIIMSAFAQKKSIEN